MKIAFLTLVGALAGSTIAQTFNGVPSCAQPCVLTYLSGSTIAGCSSLDVACICSNASFLSNIACCLAGACSATDQQAAVTFAQNLCKSYGVTNLPNSVSCASSATSAATGVTASGTASAASTTGSSSASAASVTTTGAATSSTAATATKNAGMAQNVAGMGAGIAGGLAAIAALL